MKTPVKIEENKDTIRIVFSNGDIKDISRHGESSLMAVANYMYGAGKAEAFEAGKDYIKAIYDNAFARIGERSCRL